MSANNHLLYHGYVVDKGTGLYYLQSRYYDPNVGRFINADSLVSTGQGLLGYHMFSYCLNNPVNRGDSEGTVSLWYYLIIDHDMGYIHRMVQLHIKTTYGEHIHSEWVLTGLGRADIVDEREMVVWEVKHARNIPDQRALDAQLQAMNYVGGEHNGAKIVALGQAGAFCGTFDVLCKGSIYQVTYNTPQMGVVLYSVEEVQVRTSAIAYEYASTPEEEKQNNAVTVAVLGGFCSVPLGTRYTGGAFQPVIPRTANYYI